MDFGVNSRVKELQAALFPIHPIPNGYITSQCLQGRLGITRRDIETALNLSATVARYRDSKDAFPTIPDTHSGIDGITQEARWPTECQVIQERIRHIEYFPATPEPYYVPNGKEPKPKSIGEDSGTVIFRYCPMSATNYFSRSCIGGTIFIQEPITNTSNINSNCMDTSLGGIASCNSDLQFESRFESGNLGKVIKITDTYYQLHLRKDLYTQRHMQWYYFRISNTRSRTIYRLSIVNFCKEDSLYNEGLRPLLYSTKDASMHAIGWRRCGDNITYYKNDSSDEEREKHTLTFNLSFPHDQDTVYLAHCYPYTYTDLQEYLASIINDPAKTKYTKLRLLCRSLAGNNVYYLTITAPMFNDDARKKKGIVITARVHPGETPSSWMMKGIIDFLTGDSNQAKELRERFIFKLVPMLNPDGVIVGNNRCSLSGKDLNRQYRTVMRESYPSVWHTKLMIRRLMEECGIAIYCDLHAHSRRHNIFIYGCESKRGGSGGKLSEQVFPLMLHKNAADKFSFENCKFHVEKGKEGTGRVVVWLMGVQNSYTMEASLSGSKIGSRAETHFSTQDYEQIGKAFCETLLDFSDEDPTKERLRNKIIARLMKEGSSADEPTNINLTDYSSDEGDTSDSSSQEDRRERTDFEAKRETHDNCPYLCVPPPSPILPRAKGNGKLRRATKKKFVDKNPPVRRKILTRRAVMDLPTTDPGSDLYDVSESGDEYYLESSVATSRFPQDNLSNLMERSDVSEKDEDGKKDYCKDYLPLPSIVRPRSLSLGEEFPLPKETHRSRQQPRCLLQPKTSRNLSPIFPKPQDVQIKMTSLRPQLWTRVSNKSQYKEDKNNQIMKSPNYWGGSSLALAYQTDSETLLKSCSKKLEALDYTHKLSGEPKKIKKKVLKKQAKIINILPIQVVEEEIPKPAKKKRTRLKRQKAINLNAVGTESNLPSSKSDKVDSLRLFGVAKLPKPEPKPKPETKRKFRKGGLVVTAATHLPKTKSKLIADPISESSSSDEMPMNMRPRTAKKKKKSLGKKKRVLSANVTLGSTLAK
ncbi:cytosolic carboxypeptidase 2-like isoform X2 [Athalia rosae]|uniref:cytosolic carboxypeptidase 2-like isoform X2 n=1 Tax=Athalia rosae TaxID=37344 RepID=UPI0020346279|nr:cytosolic carboxypeptidase 2-like isoform X2 [Athalia rosae]